jgi:hypothetical protein
MKKFSIFLLIFFGVGVLVWGVLTRLGYIQNYLGVEFLYSEADRETKERYENCLRECQEDYKDLLTETDCRTLCTSF